MKPTTFLLFAPLLLGLPCAAQQIPVNSSIGYDAATSSNNIVLTWESIPTKLYNVLTTTALGQQPWVPLNPSPIYSSNNLVRYRDTNNQPARFYKVVKLDTDPPEIWRLNPGSNSFSVALQNPLKIWLRDETGIDPVSLVLSVGTNFNGQCEYPPCSVSFTPDCCYNRGGAYLGSTATVGSYVPNAWGLYDMHGNVWEWCSDWWSSNLPGGSLTDPQGPATGARRVVRGGGWIHLAFACRSAFRLHYYPDYRYNFLGFRVVLAPGQP